MSETSQKQSSRMQVAKKIERGAQGRLSFPQRNGLSTGGELRPSLLRLRRAAATSIALSRPANRRSGYTAEFAKRRCDAHGSVNHFTFASLCFD
jgi:hypothetical protein